MEGQRGPGAKGSEHETALRTADVALVDQLLELDGAANYIATVPPSRTAAGELVPHSIATTATISTVKPTCRLPAPITSRRAANHCRERKLKTHHEHEKNDAEFGLKSSFVARGDELQTVRPDHQAGK